jgi:hypothetical protein
MTVALEFKSVKRLKHKCFFIHYAIHKIDSTKIFGKRITQTDGQMGAPRM